MRVCNVNHIWCLVQDCSNSIANALELLQSCSGPSICRVHVKNLAWGLRFPVLRCRCVSPDTHSLQHFFTGVIVHHHWPVKQPWRIWSNKSTMICYYDYHRTKHTRATRKFHRSIHPYQFLDWQHQAVSNTSSPCISDSLEGWYCIHWNLSVTSTSIIRFITCNLFINVF